MTLHDYNQIQLRFNRLGIYFEPTLVMAFKMFQKLAEIVLKVNKDSISVQIVTNDATNVSLVKKIIFMSRFSNSFRLLLHLPFQMFFF